MPRHCMHYIFEFFVDSVEAHRVESTVFFHLPDDRAPAYSSSNVHFIINMDANGRVTIRQHEDADINRPVPPPPPPSSPVVNYNPLPRSTPEASNQSSLMRQRSTTLRATPYHTTSCKPAGSREQSDP